MQAMRCKAEPMAESTNATLTIDAQKVDAQWPRGAPAEADSIVTPSGALGTGAAEPTAAHHSSALNTHVSQVCITMARL
eukprot:5562522-Prymnesium_polylepis.2